MTTALVVDTSALVAILFDEPDREVLESSLAFAPNAYMSTANFVEFSLVGKSRLPKNRQFGTRAYIESYGIERVGVTPRHADLGLLGKQKFPVLNFGDTFAYALAKDLDLPLLFKGNDFSQTDLKSAL